MNQAARIKQEQACHIKFKQHVQDGNIPNDITCHDYAADVVGRPVASLKDLSDSELNALRDRLEGKPNKALEAIYAIAREAGIVDLDAWLRSCARRSRAWSWVKGHNPSTLPYRSQWRLLKILQTRKAELQRTSAEAWLNQQPKGGNDEPAR